MLNKLDPRVDSDNSKAHDSNNTSHGLGSNTTSTGYFTKSIFATVDGCWNVRTADTDYYAGRFARVNGDCVDVRK